MITFVTHKIMNNMKVYDNSGNYKILPKYYEDEFDITVTDMSSKRLTKQERANLRQCLRYGIEFVGKSISIDEVIRMEAQELKYCHPQWSEMGRLIRSVEFTGIEKRVCRCGMDYYVRVSRCGIEFRIEGVPVFPPNHEPIEKNVI